MRISQLVGGVAMGVNAQTGTSYTLVKSDAGKVVTMTNAASNTVTVPAGVFGIGAVVEVVQLGAGVTTVAGAVGVTIRTPATLSITAQYGTVRLVQVAANVWVASGSI